MIEFRNVSFAYGGAGDGVLALRDVSFALAPGEMLAVVGKNGSGKSTLARLSDGLLVPTSGAVVVDGMDTRDDDHVWDVRARVGLVFQNPDNQIVGTSVEEDVAFGPENLGLPRDEIRRRVDLALSAVGLADLSGREPHMLSEGQKQRLAIAGVLALRPEYVVADEPTAMLDPQSRAVVGDILRRTAASGAGVLNVTHDLSEVACADRLLVLAGGGVAFLGAPAELFEDESALAELALPLPPLLALAAALRRQGADVPALPSTAEDLVDTLWA